VEFKATTSSNGKSKKKEESSDDEDASSSSSMEDEDMALFVHRSGKFMKKKGYGARRRLGMAVGRFRVRDTWSSGLAASGSISPPMMNLKLIGFSFKFRFPLGGCPMEVQNRSF
jgi:hypothetical protein